MLEWQVWRLRADISLGHRAWRKANSDSTGRARRRYDQPRCVSRLESMTWGRTRRGPRSINADDSGSEEERAAGGPGPGAVDPGERGGTLRRVPWATLGRELGPSESKRSERGISAAARRAARPCEIRHQ